MTVTQSLRQRLLILKNISEDDLHPADYYERQLLQGLHEDDLNIAPHEDMPSYDDLADRLNIIKALLRIQDRINNEIMDHHCS